MSGTLPPPWLDDVIADQKVAVAAREEMRMRVRGGNGSESESAAIAAEGAEGFEGLHLHEELLRIPQSSADPPDSIYTRKVRARLSIQTG